MHCSCRYTSLGCSTRRCGRWCCRTATGVACCPTQPPACPCNALPNAPRSVPQACRCCVPLRSDKQTVGQARQGHAAECTRGRACMQCTRVSSSGALLTLILTRAGPQVLASQRQEGHQGAYGPCLRAPPPDRHQGGSTASAWLPPPARCCLQAVLGKACPEADRDIATFRWQPVRGLRGPPATGALLSLSPPLPSLCLSTCRRTAALVGRIQVADG